MGGTDMKLSACKKLLICLLAVCFALGLWGCDLSNLVYESTITSTDADGNEYVILNPNHFRFDTYNVLEVVVSDTERFLLHDEDPADNAEMGPGLWIKDGVTYSVWFYSAGEYGKKFHGDLIISAYGCYDAYTQSYAPLSGVYIAAVKNDPEKPGLQWWESGDFSYNVSFSKEVTPVAYHTLTVDDAARRYRLSEGAYAFFTVTEGVQTTYTCPEAGLRWDGATGLGTWEDGGKIYPVRVEFDEKEFSIAVTSATGDEFEGKRIYSGKGQTISERDATFSVEEAPHVFSTVQTLTVQRTDAAAA